MAANNVPNDAGKILVHPSNQSKWASFCSFLYDPKNHTVLGRTGKSWFEITIFYVIFYAFLAAFFAVNLAIFLQTLSPNNPRYYGKGSIIGTNPGLGYQPWLRSNAESTLISFDPSNKETYSKYVDALNDFWSNYSSSGDGLRKCNKDAGESNRDNSSEPCIFDLSVFDKSGCIPPYFGFDKGTPCIILTLNKLLGWEPVVFPRDSLPAALPKQLVEAYNGDVPVACEGEFFPDQENIGELEYIPPSGIDRKMFPYKFMAKYQQPFAMVKFKSLREGAVIAVECKAYAYNIVHDRANRLGMVHFEMHIQPKSSSKATAEPVATTNAVTQTPAQEKTTKKADATSIAASTSANVGNATDT